MSEAKKGQVVDDVVITIVIEVGDLAVLFCCIPVDEKANAATSSGCQQNFCLCGGRNAHAISHG